MNKYPQKQWHQELATIIDNISAQSKEQRKKLKGDYVDLYFSIARLVKTLRDSANSDIDDSWQDKIQDELDRTTANLKETPEFKEFSFDFSQIPLKVKVEKTQLIPSNLPETRGNSSWSEPIYDFYRANFYRIERFLRSKFVRFKLRKSLEYNCTYYLNEPFEKSHLDYVRLRNNANIIIKQVQDIFNFAISDIKKKPDLFDFVRSNIKQDKYNKLAIQSGILRAAGLFDSFLVEIVQIRSRTFGIIDFAIYNIQRNVLEESMLARTSVETFIWTRRDFENLYLWFVRVYKKILKYTNIFARSSEEVAKHVPKVFEKIERTINLEQSASSFLREINFETKYPEELSRVFSNEPVDIPMFFGREEIFDGLSQEYARFKAGGSSQIVLYGGSGVGKQSVIKVAIHEWTDTVNWNIDHRILSSVELDSELMKILNLDSRQIVEEIHKGPRRIVLVRKLERLYRREIGGYDAIQRFIDIVNATGSRIMWVLQTNDIAFKFLDGIFGLGRLASRVIHVKPHNRKELEAMLLHRLHFTGYSFFYMPDESLSPKMRKKLKDQKKIRTLFFDRIFELSLGYPLSALFFVGNSIRRMSESMVFFRTPPQARFDALAGGTIGEKLLFKKFIESSGFFPEESFGKRFPVEILAENMGILERKYITDGEILKIRRCLEPIIRDILIDRGIIQGAKQTL